jgi:hypothetical protein
MLEIHSIMLRLFSGEYFITKQDNIFTWWSVTTDGVWIDDRNYCTLIHLQILTTSNYSATANSHSATHLSLLGQLCLHQSSGNCFQRRNFPFPWVPKLSRASATSFYQQQLTRTELQQSSNSLTYHSTHSTPLTNSGAGGHLTTTFCSSHCRLKILF